MGPRAETAPPVRGLLTDAGAWPRAAGSPCPSPGSPTGCLPVPHAPACHQEATRASELVRCASSFLAHLCLFMKRARNRVLPNVKIKLMKCWLFKGMAQILSFNPNIKCPPNPKEGCPLLQESLSIRQRQKRPAPAVGVDEQGLGKLTRFHPSSIAH